MKSLVKYIAFMLIIGLFILSSCDPNDGIDPDQDVRASYLGIWSCQESGLAYNVTVKLDSSNSTQVLIYNFHLQGSSEYVACIATANNLTLPSQTYCGNTVSGSGILVNTNKFTMKYYVNDQADIDTVNATYTK